MLCPVCSSQSKPSFEAKNYRFSKCDSSICGHVFVDPMPTMSELEAYYATSSPGLENSDSWTMSEDYASDPELVHRFYQKNRIGFLERRGYLRPVSSVLDVGCSTGMFLRVLKDRGSVNLCGVDVSTEQMEHCEKVNGIRAYRNLVDIPDDETFDLVCLYAVLEHVPNPREVLKNAVQRMSFDAHLIVDVPNYRSIYRYVARKRWLWLIPPVHLQYFTPKSMERLASLENLEIEYASTKSTSTYTYILVHHLFELMRREIPNTSLSTSRFRTTLVYFFELIMRMLLSPLSVLMRFTGTHNQIIYVFKKKV